MKISILQENLNKGLSIAVRTIANRPQLPVLTHVLLTTDQNQLKISSTNLETGVNLWIGAKVERNGSISVPAKIFYEFISSLPAGKIEIETQENILKVKTDSSQAQFNGLGAGEFPKMPSIKGKPALSLPSDSLSKAVTQVAFAAASDETRPALTGIYFFAKDNNLTLVATDGYRLSLKKLSKDSNAELDKRLVKGLIIPAKAFQEAARAASEEGDEVGFYLAPDSNQLIFKTGDIEIITRLIEGKFPEFEKIIPKEGKIKASVETSELQKCAKIASIFARESANIIRFKLTQEGIEVSANTAQIGENKNLVKATVTGGEDKIAFNSLQ